MLQSGSQDSEGFSPNTKTATKHSIDLKIGSSCMYCMGLQYCGVSS